MLTKGIVVNRLDFWPVQTYQIYDNNGLKLYARKNTFYFFICKLPLHR